MAGQPNSNFQRSAAGNPMTIGTSRSLSDDSTTRTSTPARDNKNEHEHENEKNLDTDDEKENGTDVLASHDDPTFPDGGWRAWLIVLG
ncbi:hypothetical protein C0992_010301, partial [Termitomyces sp. T32_za158]